MSNKLNQAIHAAMDAFAEVRRLRDEEKAQEVRLGEMKVARGSARIEAHRLWAIVTAMITTGECEDAPKVEPPAHNPLDGVRVTYLGENEYRLNLRGDASSTVNAEYFTDGKQIGTGHHSGNNYAIHDIHEILRTCDRAVLAQRLARARVEAGK